MPRTKAIGTTENATKVVPRLNKIRSRGNPNPIDQASAASPDSPDSPAMPAIPSTPSPSPSPSIPEDGRFDSKYGKSAVNSRWAAEKATEAEIREAFLTMPTDQAVEILGRMRNNCEIAAKAIQAGIERNKQEDRCFSCGGPKAPNKQWAFIKAVRHPTTHLLFNRFFCTTACVSRENIRNQGPQAGNPIK